MSYFAPRALVLAGIVVLEAIQSRRMFSVAVIASAAQLPSTERSAQFSIGLLCLQICLCSAEVLGFRVGASPSRRLHARVRVCVCVANKEAPQLYLGNNVSLQMGAEETLALAIVVKKITTIAIGKTGQEAKGGEDTLRQGESHKGKLNSLVNVSNQGTNLPGIGCLTNRAH